MCHCAIGWDSVLAHGMGQGGLARHACNRVPPTATRYNTLQRPFRLVLHRRSAEDEETMSFLSAEARIGLREDHPRDVGEEVVCKLRAS